MVSNLQVIQNDAEHLLLLLVLKHLNHCQAQLCGNLTQGLRPAVQVLYQLSYSPRQGDVLKNLFLCLSWIKMAGTKHKQHVRSLHS